MPESAVADAPPDTEDGMTPRERLDRLFADVWALKDTFIARWKELADHVLPTKPRWSDADTNKGNRTNSKIIDGTATQAKEIAMAGMLSSMASPSRPWFQYALPLNRGERTDEENKWLSSARDVALAVCDRSNFYTVLGLCFESELVFATGCFALFEHPLKVIQCQEFPIGSYSLAQNADGEVDTFVREYTSTVAGVVRKYGFEQASYKVREAYKLKRYQEAVVLRHMIYPNTEARPEPVYATDKAWKECIWEKDSPHDEPPLFEGGFDEFPIIAARWHKNHEDVFGTSCPAMVSLGNIKMLQQMVRKRLNGLNKQVDPALKAPLSQENRATSLLAGEITYYDATQGEDQVRPIHEVKLPYAELVEAENQVRERIRDAFMVRLWLMWTTEQRSDITAAEVYARDREKALLGPTQERHSDDVFDKALGRILAILQRRSRMAWMVKQDGLLPLPPESIIGQDVRPEYVSEAAVAQKGVGIAGLERHTQYMGVLAQMYGPTALDPFDADEASVEHADMLGVAPKVTRGKEDIAQIRDHRAQAQQQAQAAQAVPALAGAAKDLGQTPVGNGNALEALAGAAT